MNPTNTRSSQSTMENTSRKFWKSTDNRKVWELTEPPKPHRSRFVERFDIGHDPATVLAHLAKKPSTHQQVETKQRNGDPSAPSPAHSLSIPIEQEDRRSFSYSLVRGAVRAVQGMTKHRSMSASVPDEDACGVEEFLALANNSGQNGSKGSVPAENSPRPSLSAASSDVERTSAE
jgi:hypothetical protein